MPWRSHADVARHNKKAARSKVGSKKWRAIANAVLERSGDEGKAVRIANAMYGGRDRKK